MKQILLLIVIMLLPCFMKSGETSAQTMAQKIYIIIDGEPISVQLANNEATQALVAALQDGNITFEVHDYGGFEKVGAWDSRYLRATHKSLHKQATSYSTMATKLFSSMVLTRGATHVWDSWSIRRRANWNPFSRLGKEMSALLCHCQ
jgi:hypothetical protein